MILISILSLQIIFKTFQTLPPIKVDTSYGQRGTRVTQQRYHALAAGKDWVRPHPPKSTFVQLTVTARTHNVSLYRQLFPKESVKHFIDR